MQWYINNNTQLYNSNRGKIYQYNNNFIHSYFALQLFAQKLLPIDWILIAFSLLQLHLLLFLSILLKLIPPFNKIQMILISWKYQISFRLSKSEVQFGTPISYEAIKDNDEQCFLLTGLKKDALQCLIIYLKNYHSETDRTGIYTIWRSNYIDIG